MFCISCGSSIAQGANFCSGCGAAVVQPPVSLRLSPPPIPSIPPILELPETPPVAQQPRRIIVTNSNRSAARPASKFRQAIFIFCIVLGCRLLYMFIGGITSRFGGTHVDNPLPVPSAQQLQAQIQQSNRYTLPAYNENSMYLGMNFAALPNDDAKRIGIDPGTGIIVTSVVPGGPADKGHIEAGDIIQGADGNILNSTFGMGTALLRHTKGQPLYRLPIIFKIYRAGEWWDVIINPAER